jgi:hypothetical protein
MSNLSSIFPVSSSNNILEIIDGVADGRTITANSNSYTFQNVTSSTTLTDSYQDVPGTSLSYTPPTGATQVAVRYYFKHRGSSYSGILGYKILVDNTTVLPSNKHIAGNYTLGGNNHPQFLCHASYVFDLTASSDNISQGIFSSWTTAKTIKVQARRYSSGYTAMVNSNRWFDGGGASGAREVDRPVIQIIAYG